MLSFITATDFHGDTIYLHPRYAEQNLATAFIWKMTVITKLAHRCGTFSHFLGKKQSDEKLYGTSVPGHECGGILKGLWDQRLIH